MLFKYNHSILQSQLMDIILHLETNVICLVFASCDWILRAMVTIDAGSGKTKNLWTLSTTKSKQHRWYIAVNYGMQCLVACYVC